MAKVSTKELLERLPDRVPFTYFPPVHYNTTITLRDGSIRQGHVYGQRDGEVLVGKTLSLEGNAVVVTDFLRERIKFSDVKAYALGMHESGYDEVLTKRVLDKARLKLPGLDMAELERSSRVNEAGPRQKKGKSREWFTPTVDGLLD